MTDLLDLMRAPPIKRPCDPNGEVVRGEVDETLTLPHPRGGWHRARIELHRHTDGLWMWGTNVDADGYGGGYRVGPKWGNFAQTRDDALHWAVQEILDRLKNKTDPAAQNIRDWAQGLA
jgi:hypothetical protein